MNEERLREYQQKGKQLFDEYSAEYSAFMKRRRYYTLRDEGVREENEIRKRYHEKCDALAKEYNDVAKPAQS